MKKIYHLSTCATNRRILKSLTKIDEYELQDIKKNPLTEEQLEEIYQMTGNYEMLFSKRSQLYKSLGLKDQNLTEIDFKKYILEHYTFLSRPVVISDSDIFVGNSPKNIDALVKKLG